MLTKMDCANVGGGWYFANGVETFASGEEKSINCGFEPKYICVMRIESGTAPNVGNGSCVGVFNSDFSREKYYTGSRTNGGAMYLTQYTIGDNGGQDITEVNSTGFKYKIPANYGGTYYWFATGYSMMTGSGSKWITPTNVSGTTWTAEWGFDADTVVLMYTHSNGYKYIMVIPTDSPSGAYYAAGSSTWTTTDVSSYVSFTDKKHISINFSTAISNVSVCPMVGKPNGYFS